MKNILSFFNWVSFTGILGIIAGILIINSRHMGGVNWPTLQGKPAVISGVAVLIGGLWFLYWGIRKGMKDVKGQEKAK